MKNITKEQKEFLNKCTNGNWELNLWTGLVDVAGDFNCSSMGLSDFLGIEFGRVSVNFYCSNNQLGSLEGSPKSVGAYFDCSYNQLVSLKGAPQEVGENFYCKANKLTSLEGAPKIVSGSFHCSHNKLVSLKGSPEGVDGYFDCSNNELVSLVGAPKKVLGNFDCSDNKLVSLEGAPQKVRYIFKCYNNQLVSLQGVESYSTMNLYCDPISLRDFDINLLDKIHFFKNDIIIKLKKNITNISNGLDPEIYLKKIIK